MTYAKTELFETDLQNLSEFCKLLAHPARLAIIRYLARTKTCMSGDISDELPLSRTTVSQHLQELKKTGLIIGTIDGVRINYCLNPSRIKELNELLESFINDLGIDFKKCC